MNIRMRWSRHACAARCLGAGIIASAVSFAGTVPLLHASSSGEIATHIKAVTVYPRGALVTRVGRVTLARGEAEQEILLAGFPEQMVNPQVRVEPEGMAHLLSVHRDRVQMVQAVSAAVQRLEGDIAEVEGRIAGLDDEIATAELQLGFLERLADGSAGSDDALAGEANTATWRQVLSMLDEGAPAAMRRIREAQRARDEATRELDRLERALEDEGGRNRSSSRLRVSLAVQAGGDAARTDSPREGNPQADVDAVDITVSYFVDQAAWHSVYIGHLDTERRVLRLEHQAEVSQSTQEPWRDVVVTLSSAAPSERMQAPHQPSRFVDIVEWFPDGAHTESRMELMSLALDSPDARVTRIDPTRDDPPRVEPPRYHLAHQAARRVSIDNRAGQAHSVFIAEHRFDVQLVSRATPRADARVFLTARVSYDGDTPLYAGPLSPVVDGVWLGTTELPDLLPDTEAVLPMGLDRLVEMRVLDQGGGRGSEGLLGRRNTLRTDYRFEIVNRHQRPTRLEILDYHPVARDERVRVLVPDAATPPDETDVEDRPGVIAWRKTLAAGETWRISHQYEVQYPEDAQITVE